MQDSGYLYLAMEYHCGGDLLRLMDERKMDEAGVRFYTAEVLYTRLVASAAIIGVFMYPLLCRLGRSGYPRPAQDGVCAPRHQAGEYLD